MGHLLTVEVIAMGRFELKLADGRVVEWEGTDGENACVRYSDANPDARSVVAWRDADRHGFFPGVDPRSIVG